MKFLEAQAEYAGVKDTVRRDELIERLMLDPSADLKRMSKGMKQKTAIIAALMGEHEILILDEPTTGLDPYMRQTFMKILLEERDRGRTIFMSSHLSDEVEAVCERVVMIRGGHIVDDITMYELEHERPQVIELDFDSVGDCAAVKQRFSQLLVNEEIQRDTRCVLSVPSNDLSRVLGSLGGMSVSCIDVHRETLEERFNETYREAYEDIGLNGEINGQER